MVAERRTEANGTRQRLVDAAAALFAERGYEQATLAAIGAAAGVTAPALYRHFRSKEELLQAALVSSLEASLGEMQAVLVEPDFVARLRALVGAQVHLRLRLRAGDGPAAFSIGHLTILLPAEMRTETTLLVRQHIRAISDLLRDGARAGVFKELDPTPTAFAIMGMIDAALWLHPGGRLDARGIRRLYQQLVQEMVVKT